MTDKATEIARLLAPTVSSLGVELMGAEYLPSPGGAVLRLYIDVPDAELAAAGDEPRMVSVEDCAAVSREVSALLDVEDPITGHYTLEVSSPGVDRPLFTVAQFARFIGESAKVTLKLPQDGRRRLQGRIERIEGETLTFVVDGAQFVTPFDNIDKARLIPDWAALGLAPVKPTGVKPRQDSPAESRSAQDKQDKPGAARRAGKKNTVNPTHKPAADKPTPAE